MGMGDDGYELLLEQGRLAVLGSLAAGLSHELNNKVAFVKSNLASLTRFVDRITQYTLYIANAEARLAKSSDEARAFVEELGQLRGKLKLDLILDDLPQLVHQSQHGMQAVEKAIADLRRFTRPDEQWVPLELNQVIDSLLDLTRSEYKHRASVERCYGVLPPVRCIPARVGHLLLCLLLNVYDSIGDRGQLRIETRKQEAGVQIGITDDGRPLDRPERALVRDFRDFSLDGLRELRLHHACRLARELGGDVGVASGPNETTVTLDLPLEPRGYLRTSSRSSERR